MEYGFQNGQCIDVPDAESDQQIITKPSSINVEVIQSQKIINNCDSSKLNPCIADNESLSEKNNSLDNLNTSNIQQPTYLENLKLKMKLHQEHDEINNDEHPCKKIKSSCNETSFPNFPNGCSWDNQN